MPQDGQLGTAPDGTPVKWVAALGRAIPVSSAQVLKPPGAAASPTAKADQTRVTNMMGSRDEAKDLAGLVNDFAIRNDRTKTGGMLAIPGVAGVVQGLGLKGSDELGMMDADALQAATRMRAPGMRLTQMEFQKFLGGVPSIKKDISVNRRFQEHANNAAINAGAQAAFYDHYLRRRGSLDGADEAWSTWSNQHFDPEGNFSVDPRADANAGLKAKSAQTQAGPRLLGYE